MADQQGHESLLISTTTITYHDHQAGTIVIETITIGTWLGEQIFEDVNRQVIVSNSIPANTTRPRPMTFQERIRSRLREEAAHHAPEPAHYPPDPMQTFHVDNVASTRDERDTQGTLHNRPTEDYQARVTPILARLRAEGVRFDDSPRRFNFARELIRPPGSSDLSSSTTTNATPVPRLTRPQRTSAVPPPRLIWDGRTLWHTAGASETTRDSEREPAHDSETETEGQPGH